MRRHSTRRRQTLMENLCEAIQQRMDERGLTARDVADASGTSFSYVYRVLNGKHVPSIEWVERVAKALDLTVHVA